MKKLWVTAAFAGLLAVPAAAQQQCCSNCDMKAAKAKATTNDKTPIANAERMVLTLPLKGIANGNLKKAELALASLGEVKTDAAKSRLTLKPKADTIRLSEIEKALEGTGVSVDRKALPLSGNVRLKVAGMTCGGCASSLKEKLTAAEKEGLKSVSVELKSVEEGYADLVLTEKSKLTYGKVQSALGGTKFTSKDVIWTQCCGNCGMKAAQAKAMSQCCGNCSMKK